MYASALLCRDGLVGCCCRTRGASIIRSVADPDELRSSLCMSREECTVHLLLLLLCHSDRYGDIRSQRRVLDILNGRRYKKADLFVYKTIFGLPSYNMFARGTCPMTSGKESLSSTLVEVLVASLWCEGPARCLRQPHQCREHDCQDSSAADCRRQNAPGAFPTPSQ